MARMFPDTLDGLRPTTGEERVFAFLKRALRPDDEHHVFFEPLLGGPRRGRTRPDFVLAGPGYGVLVLEVKDFHPDALARGGPKQLVLRQPGGGETRITHPEEQARGYGHRLHDLLRGTPGFLHDRGPHSGELALPVNSGVVLPNVKRRDLDALERRGVLFHRDRCLTAELFERDDAEGTRQLLAALERVCDVRFRFDIDGPLRKRLRAVLQPQIHFLDLRDTDAPEPGTAPAEPDSRVERAPLPELPGFFLDRKQERMARALASPRTVVYGPAGSGKTVFLTARARYWAELYPDARILFTCYNSSLASHIRHVFALKGLAADDERLTVIHYHDLCRRFLGMGPDFHEKDPEFYAVLEPRVLQELARRDDAPAWDLILVDEGQDFTRRMFEVLVRLTASGGEITVVCDPAQDVYRRWSEGNLEPLGRYESERLVDCYRNTAPIFDLALAVLPPEVRTAMGFDRLEMTRPEDLGRTGPPPDLRKLDGLDGLVALIAETIRDFDEAGRPLSDLAVLYPHRDAIPNFAGRLRHSKWGAARDAAFARPGAGEDDRPREAVEDDPRPALAAGHFADALENELRARNLPAEWMARDYASRSAYDISRTRLTISTVHSAKGMDYHTVILLGADSLAWDAGAGGGKASSLLFTGITRARDRLIVPYFLDQGWVPHLRERLPE